MQLPRPGLSRAARQGRPREGLEGFLRHMAASYGTADPQEVLVGSLRRFVGFCTVDLPRYQLLFQRTVPGYEPSAESYAPAVRALELSAEVLAVNGLTDPRHLDV